MMPAMSSCRFVSFMEHPLARYGFLGLLVSMSVVAACASVSDGGAGQKVATALEEMSVVMVLLLLHLTYSKLRGDDPAKAQKNKIASADCDGTVSAPDKVDEPNSVEARQQAIGKITTKIRAAVKAGNMLSAETLMQSMREVGGQPGQLRRACWSVAFGEIVNGYVHLGNAEKAGEWLDAFAACAPTIRPSSACANSVITALCASGDVASAEAWLAKMPRVGIRVGEETFSALIHGCMGAGEVQSSIRWLRGMRKANFRPSAELNQLVLKACAEARSN